MTQFLSSETEMFSIQSIKPVDDSRVTQIWREQLLEAQTNKEETSQYIERQLKYDMGKPSEFYDGKKGIMLVATTAAGEMAGFAAIGPSKYNPNELLLQRVSVLPQYRHMGVASGLISTLLSRVDELNSMTRKVGTTVDQNNVAMQSLLTKMGFHILPVNSLYLEYEIDLTYQCETPDCDGNECLACGQKDCPHGEPLHYHHDGCPACYQRP